MAHTVRTAAAAALLSLAAASSSAQLIDRTQAPNIANEGIAKSLEQIGAGRGDWTTPDSSSFIIARDPFRAIRRGRQLFQRKFTRGRARARSPATARRSSTRTSRSARAWPTAAPRATAGRAARPASAATSSRGPTAATRRTCSASA